MGLLFFAFEIFGGLFAGIFYFQGFVGIAHATTFVGNISAVAWTASTKTIDAKVV